MCKKIVLVILFLTVILINGQTMDARNWEPMIEAYLATGADYLGTELCGWTIKSGQYYSLEELEKWGRKLASEHGLEWEEIKPAKFQDNGYISVNYHCTLQSGEELSFSGQSCRESNELGKKTEESYLVVTLATNDDLNNISSKISKLKLFLKSFGKEYDLTYNLHGAYARFLSSKEKQDLLERFFSVLKAKSKENIQAENYLSCTGYSPLLKEEIKIGKDKINVQIALTDYESDERTYLIIGCPLISIEY